MVDNTVPVSTAPNTAEQAAAMNAAYIAGVAYVPGNFVSPQQDAANEAAKQQAAFSQPRNDTSGQNSAEYNAIVAQYNQQKSYSIGSGGRTYRIYLQSRFRVFVTTSQQTLLQILSRRKLYPWLSTYMVAWYSTSCS